jgi:hypothetical protein
MIGRRVFTVMAGAQVGPPPRGQAAGPEDRATRREGHAMQRYVAPIFVVFVIILSLCCDTPS